MPTNLVQNGDFSTGSLAQWVTAGEPYWSYTGSGMETVSGNGYAGGSGEGFLRQSISGLAAGVQHSLEFQILDLSNPAPGSYMDVSVGGIDIIRVDAGNAADPQFYLFTPSSTTEILEFALSTDIVIELDDIEIFTTGTAPPSWDFTDDGFWRTQVRTRETVSTYSDNYIQVGAESYESGLQDGLAWAVGKTPTEISDEENAQFLVVLDYSTRDSFDWGRTAGLSIAGGSTVPPFTESAIRNPIQAAILYGGFAAVTDRTLASPVATAMQFVVESDEFNRIFNLSYRAGWEAAQAAAADVAASNPHGTSKVYDTSLIVSQFDTYDFDIYVDSYDRAYDSVFPPP